MIDQNKYYDFGKDISRGTRNGITWWCSDHAYVLSLSHMRWKHVLCTAEVLAKLR